MGSVLRSENVHPLAENVHPILKLAKLLHYRGFHITFVNTQFIHSVLLKTQGPDSLNGISTFRFETIPDGIPPSDIQSKQHI
ncbi:hypothetical protein Pint_03778 [Pistacia integerrima]|uniref:Uncharacterized protein n=1 Tax=Pistacia integerrima TaxID=434235 RepID=A0ACC0Z4L2_9ROSI|nr:hypothetical protein Pint_03778 [Pistacia integerrima]